MWSKGIPKYILIFYRMEMLDYIIGDFKPRIYNSIPFNTENEAKEYLRNFLNITGGNDAKILYAIIPTFDVND